MKILNIQYLGMPLSSILVIFSVSIYAQDKNVSLLPTMTVTEKHRTATVTVIDKEEIDNQHSSVVFDVLEKQPGLNVVRRLGFTGSGLSRMTIRGNGNVGPAGIQVLVDGRPDATVSFAHPTPSALSLENVKRIEVIHGPSPVLHGSGKTGVINITTADPDPGFHAFVEGSYGSFNTSENFARVSYGGERGYLRASGSYRKTDGDNIDSDARVKSLNIKGGFKFNNIFSATFTAGKNSDEFDVFDEFFVPGPFTDPRTDTLDLTQTILDFTLNAELGNTKSSIKFYHDDLNPRSQVLDAPEETAGVNEKGIRFKTEWAATDRTNITGGVDYLHAKASNSPVLPPFAGPGLAIPRDRLRETLNELGIYAFVEHSLLQSLSVSGGVRYTDHSAFGSETSGEVGLAWTPVWENVDNFLYGTTFRARATRGYQAPTLQQLYGIFRGGRGGPANPNLNAEVLKQYEVGFNHPFSKGNVDVVFYVQDGEGLIETPAAPPPPPPDITNNIDYANRGIEARIHFYPTVNWETMLGVTVADFEQNNNRFLRVPEKTIDFGITYKHSFLRTHDFTINLAGRYAKDTFDVPITPAGSPRVKLDDYFVADLTMNYHVNKYAKTFLSIDNVTNENYELVTGIPLPSISVFTGISLEY